VAEPTPNLLAASRMRLQEALETTRQGGLWQRLILEPAIWLRQIRMAPALAAAIFMVGFARHWATYNWVANRPSIVANDGNDNIPIRRLRSKRPRLPDPFGDAGAGIESGEISSTTRF